MSTSITQIGQETINHPTNDEAPTLIPSQRHTVCPSCHQNFITINLILPGPEALTSPSIYQATLEVARNTAVTEYLVNHGSSTELRQHNAASTSPIGRRAVADKRKSMPGSRLSRFLRRARQLHAGLKRNLFHQRTLEPTPCIASIPTSISPPLQPAQQSAPPPIHRSPPLSRAILSTDPSASVTSSGSHSTDTRHSGPFTPHNLLAATGAHLVLSRTSQHGSRLSLPPTLSTPCSSVNEAAQATVRSGGRSRRACSVPILGSSGPRDIAELNGVLDGVERDMERGYANFEMRRREQEEREGRQERVEREEGTVERLQLEEEYGWC